jgi:hypothetical protein
MSFATFAHVQFSTIHADLIYKIIYFHFNQYFYSRTSCPATILTLLNKSSINHLYMKRWINMKYDYFDEISI